MSLDLTSSGSSAVCAINPLGPPPPPPLKKQRGRSCTPHQQHPPYPSPLLLPYDLPPRYSRASDLHWCLHLSFRCSLLLPAFPLCRFPLCTVHAIGVSCIGRGQETVRARAAVGVFSAAAHARHLSFRGCGFWNHRPMRLAGSHCKARPPGQPRAEEARDLLIRGGAVVSTGRCVSCRIYFLPALSAAVCAGLAPPTPPGPCPYGSLSLQFCRTVVPAID